MVMYFMHMPLVSISNLEMPFTIPPLDLWWHIIVQPGGVVLLSSQTQLLFAFIHLFGPQWLPTYVSSYTCSVHEYFTQLVTIKSHEFHTDLQLILKLNSFASPSQFK